MTKPHAIASQMRIAGAHSKHDATSRARDRNGLRARGSQISEARREFRVV
jgi:hypothetical protein